MAPSPLPAQQRHGDAHRETLPGMDMADNGVVHSLFPFANPPEVIAAPISLQNRAARLRPLMLGSAGTHGTVVGNDKAELATALATGARRMLFGEHTNELSRMLPQPTDNDVLQIAVEGRLIYGSAMAKHLADAIHHRIHLTSDARPVLHVVLFELISNAIEHGNLGLTRERHNPANHDDWFEGYLRKVEFMLGSALGRIPLLISCRRVDGLLEISIEDRGMGFNVRQVLERIRSHRESPTGRGLDLVLALLDNQVDYTNSGRRVTFRLPLRPRDERSMMPNLASIREQARVLIVDDQELNLRVASMAFEKAGFKHVSICQKSTEAVAEARRLKPDLMLLDIMMPDLDGYAICAQMKADPALKDIPVMFLTAYGDSDHRTRGYKLGGVDFATKPIEPVELIARSETHLLNSVMLRTLSQHNARVNKDLERARTFQQDLLPSAASLTTLARNHNLDLATCYQGCDTLAGDYWTLFELDGENIAFCMIDFTGHGVLAALNTVQLHTLLHHAGDMHDPVRVATRLNRHLHQLLGSDSLATYVYGTLNTHTGKLAYAAGGAPSLVIRHPDGRTTELECSGLPLGFEAHLETVLRGHTLKPGDTLVAVSDAITESPHAGGLRWGQEGLAQALQKLPSGLPASQLLSRMLDNFHATVQLPVPDDLTALMLTFGYKKDKKQA